MLRVSPWTVPACLLLAGCNGLFYFPSRRLYDWPSQPFENVSIATEDGETLHAWLFAARGKPRGTVVQFHGNAANVTAHFQSLVWLTEHGYSLLTFDYRGYGRSTGVPSPRGLAEDALSVMRYAQSLPVQSAGAHLVLYGQSLGGAVLLHSYPQLEPRTRVRAVIVEGTFHSYQEIAASVLYRHWLLLPLTGLAYTVVSDETSPSAWVGRVSPTPLLIIHGERDPTIPPAFGRALYGLSAEPHEFWIAPEGGHIDAMTQPDMCRRLLRYLERVCPLMTAQM
jgi:fermentation-respiration switch protein FrsA (DUF1100 family)